MLDPEMVGEAMEFCACGGIVGFQKDKSKRRRRSGATEKRMVMCKVSLKEVIP